MHILYIHIHHWVWWFWSFIYFGYLQFLAVLVNDCSSCPCWSHLILVTVVFDCARVCVHSSTVGGGMSWVSLWKAIHDTSRRSSSRHLCLCLQETSNVCVTSCVAMFALVEMWDVRVTHSSPLPCMVLFASITVGSNTETTFADGLRDG